MSMVSVVVYVEAVMVLLDGAGANDSKEKGLGVRLGRCGGRDGGDLDHKNLSELSPKCLFDQLDWMIAITSIPVDSKLVLIGCK